MADNVINNNATTSTQANIEQARAHGSSAKENVRKAADRGTKALKDAGKASQNLFQNGYERSKNVAGAGWNKLQAAPAATGSVLKNLGANLTTERKYASDTLRNGCLLGAAVGFATSAFLVYKDIAIEVFKGVLLHDLTNYLTIASLLGLALNTLIRLVGFGPAATTTPADEAVAAVAGAADKGKAKAEDTAETVGDTVVDDAEKVKDTFKDLPDVAAKVTNEVAKAADDATERAA